MTDNELMEAAAMALGWEPINPGTDAQAWLMPCKTAQQMVGGPPPIDWTTAGALLELCTARKDDVRVETWIDLVSVDEAPSGHVTARNVIEACVLALQ